VNTGQLSLNCILSKFDYQQVIMRTAAEIPFHPVSPAPAADKGPRTINCEDGSTDYCQLDISWQTK
jgi:hypothetical protein